MDDFFVEMILVGVFVEFSCVDFDLCLMFCVMGGYVFRVYD